jgi:hypothetical protein
VWRAWLIPVVAGLCLLAAAVLILVRLKTSTRVRGYVAGAATVGVLALLIAPAAWSAYASLALQGGGPTPAAGPRPIEAEGGPGGPPDGPGGGFPRSGGPGGMEANPVLLEYLQANKGDATYLVAGPSSMPLSPIILGTDEKVINMGGFRGRDPVFTTEELSGFVEGGAVRFFLMPDREAMEEMRAEREAAGDGSPPPSGPTPGGPQGGFGPGGGLPQNGSAEWIVDNCEKVPQELWQPPEDEGRGRGGPPGRTRALYDCDARGS